MALAGFRGFWHPRRLWHGDLTCRNVQNISAMPNIGSIQTVCNKQGRQELTQKDAVSPDFDETAPLFENTRVSWLHVGVDLSELHEDRFAVCIVHAVIVRYRVEFASCVDCQALDLVLNIAVERSQVGQQVANLFF